MQHRLSAPAAALAAIIGFAAVASAQQAKPKHETQAQLRHEAKISLDSARAVARATVPNGKIASSELERENGKLIYSFDMRVKGKTGIEEVNVDAKTGELVAHEHESPAAEKKEAKAEAKEHSAQPKPAKP